MAFILAHFLRFRERFLSIAAFMLISSTSWCSYTFAQITINEYSVSNLSTVQDNYGKYEDWIEIHNGSVQPFDLQGYYLSDNPSRPLKWQFTAGSVIPAGGHIIVWASGRNEIAGGHYHANFKLTQTKDQPEYIVLSNPSGQLIEVVELQLTQRGHSRGRKILGMGWAIYTNPSPGMPNTTTGYNAYTATPELSLAAGFYSGSQTISLSTSEPDGIIRYTLNGSEPTANSPIYTNPITISQTTIINARTFSNQSGILPGLIAFSTYFINVEHTMPVISVSAATLTDLLNGNQSLRPFGTFEYFDQNKQRLTFGYGEFNEHGQDSWVHPQRSIDYITRDECGYNYAIREKLIPLTNRDEFQRIILRAAGDDNYPGNDSGALLRDMFVQNTASINNMHLDVRKGEKCVMYVNGLYWGVYGMREKVSDHDFTSFYYGQDKYNLYYLQLWGNSWAEYGGQAAFNDWYNLRNYIKNNDMSNQTHFEYVKTRFDYKSLVDYIIINSFVVCTDWINWNVGWWRGLNPEGGHLKWGYVLWDEDATFNHYINYSGVPSSLPTVSPCFPQGMTMDPEQHIVVLNRLRNNAEFNQYYVSRYIDLYNTVFKPENFIGYLDEIVAKMEPEMPKHIQRWGGTMTKWQSNVQKIRNFVNTRYSFLPQGLRNCYNLTGPFDFEVQVLPEGTGTVTVNSLDLSSFPWSGKYFGGMQVRLNAMPANANFEFDTWEFVNHTPTPNVNSQQIQFMPSQPDVIIARFRPKLFSDSLVINEINYNSSATFNTEDWVEFYNPHPYDLDITNWVFKDEDDTHSFVFPAGTVMESHGYLVLVRNMSLFKSRFPDVNNVIGSMSFGFSGSGELLRLYNDQGVLVDHVEYSDKAPWPTAPDGNGPTLELKSPLLDNALPQSWMASPTTGGTPGAMNSQLVQLAEIQHNKKNSISLEVFPQPANGLVYLKLSSSHELEGGTISVFNVFGNHVRSLSNVHSGYVTFDSNQLANGVYVLVYQNRNGEEAKAKMVVSNSTR